MSVLCAGCNTNTCSSGSSVSTSSSCTASTSTPATSASTGLWFDRTVYLSNPSGSDPDRNNVFYVSNVRTALNYIAANTSLGANYFNFVTVDEGQLSPVTSYSTQIDADFKSFILVWPHSVFADFALNTIQAELPDPYAITVMNAANKRQFYIILDAACFNGQLNSDGLPVCGQGALVGTYGQYALIARQLGRIVGIQLGCDSSPLYNLNLMCPYVPSNSQWLSTSLTPWLTGFSNNLDLIRSISGYYP
jgi:hypothetical protein